jgi:hypothetical protein
MNDVLSENVRDLHSRVAETEDGIAERVHAATTAAGIAAGQAGDVARQAWSQAGDVAEDVVDAGRRATGSMSRQIHENPLITVLVGIAFACIAGLWLRGGGPTAKAPSASRSRVATTTKKVGPQ